MHVKPPSQPALHVQSVWSGQKRMIGTFLHSPMLDELKSLEAILMEKVCAVVHSCRRSMQYSCSGTLALAPELVRQTQRRIQSWTAGA